MPGLELHSEDKTGDIVECGFAMQHSLMRDHRLIPVHLSEHFITSKSSGPPPSLPQVTLNKNKNTRSLSGTRETHHLNVNGESEFRREDR